MTPQDRIDTGFAPWSLMTPDPAKARATKPAVQTASLVHEDKRAPDMPADDGYMFGDDGMTFGDLLDIVNPLQHLPVIGAVYRSITGDEADPGAKMAGGALYGGPLGFASAMINSAIEEHTGDDVMGHMLAMVGLGDDDGDAINGGDAVVQASAQTGTAAGGVSGSISGAYPGIAPTIAPGTPPIGAEAEMAANALFGNNLAANPLAANANASGDAMQLDARQAALLERFAAKASSDSPADAEPLDALLSGTQTAAAQAEQSGQRKDFGGATRISGRMAQHLAMLAQAGSPSQALAQQAAMQAEGGQSAARAEADMRAASAKYNAALPLSINGKTPEANPFAAIEARQNEPDPFETAMNRLGLNPPTVKTRGGEDTQSEVMKAAFPETAGQSSSQLANMAAAASSEAGISPPPDTAVPSAMMDALNRYQAMKQQG